MGVKYDQSWKSETKICILCSSTFSPHPQKDKAGWERQKFCGRTCSGKANGGSEAKTNLEDRFWAKVDKSAGHGPWGNCWIWTGGTTGPMPHGAIHTGPGSKKMRTHRYSYQLHNGPLGDFDVCHKCDNPPCVNPGHLFLGTHRDNMEDMKEKKRTAWGVLATSAKLTEDDVRAIRKDPRIGRLIAEQYGVSLSNIYNIKNRKKWANLPD